MRDTRPFGIALACAVIAVPTSGAQRPSGLLSITRTPQQKRRHSCTGATKTLVTVHAVAEKGGSHARQIPLETGVH